MRRNAVLFILISALSGFGSTAMTLAAGVWMVDLTGSVSLAALTGLCIYAPVFASPWLGAIADRVPRRPLLIVIDIALGLLLLTLLTVSTAREAWLIYAVLLARGVSYALGDAAETAILPSALPPKLLADVNGWRSSAQEGMKLLAPLAGAGLYAWRGPTPVVLVCSIMPLLTAACYALLRLRPPRTTSAQASRTSTALSAATNAGAGERARGGRDDGGRDDGGRDDGGPNGGGRARAGRDGGGRARGRRDGGGRDDGGRDAGGRGRGEVRAGVKALFGNAAVRDPVLIAAVAIGLSGLTNAGLIGQVVHTLGLPATRLGVLSTAQGAGSIVSGLLAGRLLARLAPVPVAALGSAVFAVGCLSSALPWWPAMIAGSALAGLGLPWALIAGVTAVQTGTPDHLLGRVAATSNTVMFGPVAVAIPVGSAAVHLGAPVPLLIAGALALVAATMGAARRRARTEERDKARSGTKERGKEKSGTEGRGEGGHGTTENEKDGVRAENE
ncbi:MFS transporter [Actinoplanes sp. CA-030573]|uniref:MFS transporter n=1 Tax=Actinoplanes sp. CA-030573 TaxID=3239898 RepID=UPI003D94FE34